MQAIRAVGLVKRYKNLTAVDGINLEIKCASSILLLKLNTRRKWSL